MLPLQAAGIQKKAGYQRRALFLLSLQFLRPTVCNEGLPDSQTTGLSTDGGGHYFAKITPPNPQNTYNL